jgi:P27 family predicted phage terminase small subunit
MPAALRVLRGKRVAKGTPIAAVGLPRIPRDLSREERAAWRQLTTEMLTVPGLLARADRGVLELAARLAPMFRRAAIYVRDHGSTLEVLDDKGGVRFVQTRPEMTVVVKLSAQLKTIYTELGLSPSGRSRLSVTPETGAASWRDALTR